MGSVRPESLGAELQPAENELGRISTALLDALHEAHELVRAGERGPPLRKALDRCRDLVSGVDEAFARYPQLADDARALTRHMEEQLTVLEALNEP
jgi:hypothetical protein